ncbi:transcription activator motif protein [Ranid herpesvirus 3]|uniref:Transcription activator motif protein n=1 Tax=Ranid herpesvirus 3 TaxID=1987509 RepID=A0A1X9T594_9VIRU|nr:transcription activator motif protein [Ranid herpesvirus 3]ARR28870.1 transcription activator motif protein [Ranid herpesvirus 3]
MPPKRGTRGLSGKTMRRVMCSQCCVTLSSGRDLYRHTNSVHGGFHTGGIIVLYCNACSEAIQLYNTTDPECNIYTFIEHTHNCISNNSHPRIRLHRN